MSSGKFKPHRGFNKTQIKDGWIVRMRKDGTIKVTGKKHTIKKNKKGDIIVDHAGKNNPKWDKINLTKKAGAKTIAQGVSATKKWHKANPHGKSK
jgi:glyceraldehyde-3-phosphate dehydrogenase/erythrose-4-phosphate dehydrogenase